MITRKRINGNGRHNAPTLRSGRPGIGEEFAFARIECGALAQVFDVVERLSDSRLFERRVPVAMVHIDRMDLYSTTLNVLHDLARRTEQ